ncbi:MAG: hypothetical protein V7K90_16405 [Nostoc sp.]
MSKLSSSPHLQPDYHYSALSTENFSLLCHNSVVTVKQVVAASEI